MTPRLLPLLCLFAAACAAQRSDYQDRIETWRTMYAEVRGPDKGELDELDALGEDADLGALVRYARRHNADLEAAFQRWRAALERVPQVTKLPEPRLTFGAYLVEVETRVGPMDGRVGLSQAFPWFGELELAGDVAFATAEAAREALEATRLEVDQRVRDTWYEYGYLEQAITITEGNRELLLHWESVARARLETGLSSHADVIRAQVELGKLEDRLQTLTDSRRSLLARLNAALNRPSDAPLPKPTYPLPEPREVDERRLYQGLEETSPVLRALDHRVTAAEHGVDLADKAFYPDFVLGADYSFIGSAVQSGVSGSGDDALAVTLGLQLPIWRSAYGAGQREAEARERSVRAERQETLNRLTSDLELAFYRFRDADRRVILFRNSLVPKGEEAVQALDTAYQAGDQGFLDLIDAQRVLLEFQLQAARAEADRAKALAETERITGVNLHPEN